MLPLPTASWQFISPRTLSSSGGGRLPTSLSAHLLSGSALHPDPTCSQSRPHLGDLRARFLPESPPLG